MLFCRTATFEKKNFKMIYSNNNPMPGSKRAFGHFTALIAVFLLILTGCKKDEITSEAPAEGPLIETLNARVVAMTAADEPYLLSMSATEIVLQAEAPSAAQIETGTILFADFGLDPYTAILREVTEVTENGTVRTLTTRPATLLQLLDEGALAHKQTYYAGDTADQRVSDQAFNINLDHVLYDHDNNPLTTDDQIKIIGSAQLHLDQDFEWQLATNSLRPRKAKWVTSVHVRTSTKLIATAGVTGEWQKELKEFQLGTFWIPVGLTGIRIPLHIEMEAIAGAVVETSASFTAGFEADARFDIGFLYENGTFQWVKNGSYDGNALEPYFSDRQGKAYAYLGLEFDIEPGTRELLELELGLKFGPELDVNLDRDPKKDWIISAVTKFYAGAELDFLGIDENPSLDVPFGRRVIDSGNFEDDDLRLVSGQFYMTGINDCFHSGGMGSSNTVTVDFLDVLSQVGPDARFHYDNIDFDTGEPYAPWEVYIADVLDQGAIKSFSTEACARFGTLPYLKGRIYFILGNGTQTNAIDVLLDRPAGANREVLESGARPAVTLRR